MNYIEKKKEMMAKYERAIFAVADANEVDIGVGFDMLKSNIIQGAKYQYVNEEEFKKDYDELLELAK